MKTAMLHELIKMANEGKKFEARRIDDNQWNKQFLFQANGSDTWSTKAILATWELKEVPQVMEFELDYSKSPSSDVFLCLDVEKYNALKRKKWKVTCTEILEEE